MKISEEMRQAVLNELRSKGGKARAKKYSKAQLTKWAKLGGKKGGRPRKDAKQ
jgi:hypothetical protein